MDEYEFRNSNDMFDWNPRLTMEESPPRFEWIPIGIYNGVDLSDINMRVGGFYDIGDDIMSDLTIEKDITVWIEIECPEYGEVM